MKSIKQLKSLPLYALVTMPNTSSMFTSMTDSSSAFFDEFKTPVFWALGLLVGAGLLVFILNSMGAVLHNIVNFFRKD